MVSPNHHYGPDVDGYEYSMWGTYHFADCQGIGVDRTTATGTGYAGQYFPPVAEIYESTDTCPDELLLFFHHVPYTHMLHSGQTVIQHIYDTHFEGAERAAHLRDTWVSLHEQLNERVYEQVLARLEHQAEHAKEWRDRINTYFYRKSGIPDEKIVLSIKKVVSCNSCIHTGVFFPLFYCGNLLSIKDTRLIQTCVFFCLV